MTEKEQSGLGDDFKTGIKRPSYSESEEESDWIDKICIGNSTIEEKIRAIVAQIEADPVYYKNVSNICSNLDHIMNFFYKNVIKSIEPFGSAVTNLALRGSDVDIFLDFGGKLPDSQKKFLSSLRFKIFKYRYFVKAVSIPARVPILQCVHRSGTVCDISFLNGLGVANSGLIKFLISLDDRARPLMLMLKFLMKREGLIGANALTSYALIVLVIYFLQKLEKSRIPAISHLQALASTKKIIADWDTSFLSDSSQLELPHNHFSVTQLLKMFFEFYASFEFGFYVISSYTAKTYFKSVFDEPDLLAPEYCCYRDNVKKNLCDKFEVHRYMCVQGPFNHCHNITRGVTEKILYQFQNYCGNSKAAYENLEKSNEKDWETEFLKKLFKGDLSFSKHKKFKQDGDISIYVGENAIFSVDINSEEDLRKRWTERVFSKLTDLLVKVMKCKINILSKKEYENDLTTFTNGEVMGFLECELYYLDLITKKRNEIKDEFEFPENLTVIEREEIISSYLCDIILTDTEKVSLKFEILCYVKKGPTCFCINLKCKEETKANKNYVGQIFQFIQSQGQKWIKSSI